MEGNAAIDAATPRAQDRPREAAVIAARHENSAASAAAQRDGAWTNGQTAPRGIVPLWGAARVASHTPREPKSTRHKRPTPVVRDCGICCEPMEVCRHCTLCSSCCRENGCTEYDAEYDAG